MARHRHYVPVISRPVVAALYHEAKRHRVPMTRPLERLLRECLQDTPGWHQARHDWPELAAALRRRQDDRSSSSTGPAIQSPASLR